MRPFRVFYIESLTSLCSPLDRLDLRDTSVLKVGVVIDSAPVENDWNYAVNDAHFDWRLRGRGCPDRKEFSLDDASERRLAKDWHHLDRGGRSSQRDNGCTVDMTGAEAVEMDISGVDVSFQITIRAIIMISVGGLAEGMLLIICERVKSKSNQASC